MKDSSVKILGDPRRTGAKVINRKRQELGIAMKLLTRIVACLAVVVGLGAGAWYTSPSWLPAVGRWLDVGETPRRVDYVMSLPGDENYRPFLAAAMINAHLADKALIVQNEPSPEESDGVALPTSEILKRVYRYCKVPDSKLVILPEKSTTTAGDIAALADFLKEHPAATVAIVTSSYHTRRARWTFGQQLGDAAERLTIVSAPNGDFDFDNWWQSEDGFLLVVMEYVKLAGYLVLYGRLVWWLGAGVAVVVLWRVRAKSKVSGARCQVSAEEKGERFQVSGVRE